MVHLLVWWLMLSLPLTKALISHVHTFMNENTILKQNLYSQYSTLVEHAMSCAVLAVDKGYDKFVFDSGTPGPGNCTLCSYCPEVGEPLSAMESHNYFGWSEL